MSTFHAIGAVSDTLRDLLKDRMELPTQFSNLEQKFSVTVSAPRPRTAGPETAEDPRVNIFLYRITENEFLKNQEIPGRGNRSSYGHPPLSLNLHYLVTGHGTTDENGIIQELPAHYLLGSAMRVLHDHPFVTDRILRQSGPRMGEPVLSEYLLSEYERMSVVPEPLSLEDITKIFTALTHPLRACGTYRVSVAQIESKRARTYPRPVAAPPGGPRITVSPLRAPVIDEVLVRPENDPGVARSAPYARVGDVVVLRGSGFGGSMIRVVLGRLEIPVEPLREDLIEVTIPDAAYPDGTPIPLANRLQPGVIAVSVILRNPEAPHSGAASNRAALMLGPRVLGATLALNASPPTLTITGRRLHHEDLSGEALVGRFIFHKALYASAAPESITLRIPDTMARTNVPCVVGGKLAPYAPPTHPSPQVSVTLGAEGPRTVELGAPPADVRAAARALQTGLAAHADAGIRFAGARVAVVDDRLVMVPGGLRGDGSAAPVALDATTANELKLRTTGPAPPGKLYRAILSGSLAEFPEIRHEAPALRLVVGATHHHVALSPRPGTLDEARAALQSGLIAGGRPDALVGILDQQLVILLDTTESIRMDAAPGDATTVSKLMLNTRHLVRVRVNGADSIDEIGVMLP